MKGDDCLAAIDVYLCDGEEVCFFPGGCILDRRNDTRKSIPIQSLTELQRDCIDTDASAAAFHDNCDDCDM